MESGRISSVAASNRRLEGTLLAGRYRLERVLGEGGMSVVYEAVQQDLGRRVALKLLSGNVSPSSLARLKVEADAMARLGNPHVVQVTDFHDAPGEPPFLVMELLSGRSLRQLMAAESVIAWERAARIGIQILAALAAAHAEGIVHRDIKPGNVFMVASSAVPDMLKVLDFGVAKLLQTPDAAPMTRPGARIGTLSYMSPEQARGGIVDARTDLYAVGVCLYEAVSGRKPIEAADTPTLIAALCAAEPVPLGTYCPHLPPAFLSIVARALRKAPAERFQSATEMADALAQCLGVLAEQAARTAISPPATPPAAGPGPSAATMTAQPSRRAASGSPQHDGTLLEHGGRAPMPYIDPQLTSLPFAAPHHHAESASGGMVSGGLPGAVPYIAPAAAPLQSMHYSHGFPPRVGTAQGHVVPRRSWWGWAIFFAVFGLVVVGVGAIVILMMLPLLQGSLEPSPIAAPVPSSTGVAPGIVTAQAPATGTLRELTEATLRARIEAAGFEIFAEESSRDPNEIVTTFKVRRGSTKGGVTFYRFAGSTAGAAADITEDASRKVAGSAFARDGSVVLFVVLQPSGARALLDAVRR